MEEIKTEIYIDDDFGSQKKSSRHKNKDNDLLGINRKQLEAFLDEISYFSAKLKNINDQMQNIYNQSDLVLKLEYISKLDIEKLTDTLNTKIKGINTLDLQHQFENKLNEVDITSILNNHIKQQFEVVINKYDTNLKESQDIYTVLKDILHDLDKQSPKKIKKTKITTKIFLGIAVSIFLYVGYTMVKDISFSSVLQLQQITKINQKIQIKKKSILIDVHSQKKYFMPLDTKIMASIKNDWCYFKFMKHDFKIRKQNVTIIK